MRTPRKQHRATSEHGQALVEFALVLPVLVLILFAVIQFGVAFNDSLALTDAVRAGARKAAVSRSAPDPAAAAESALRKAAADLDETELAVAVDSSWVRGESVRVHASYPFELSLLGIPVVSGRLESETTERVE
jgi:Flp pilus assembly protein TadG